MQAKIIHITLTDPHICLQERVTQNMPKMTLYTREKLHLWDPIGSLYIGTM